MGVPLIVSSSLLIKMAFVVSLNVLVFLMDDESFVQAQTSSDCLPSLQDALEVD